MPPPMQYRRTPRLQGYDYRQAGSYFVTIVTANREHIFGEVADEKMQRNAYGDIVAVDYLAIPNHFPTVKIEDHVVMPNHFHGIVTLTAEAVTLSAVINGFKGGVTRRINALRETPGATVWQRSFHERIIRDENEYARIQEYIANNPLRWALDKENTAR